MSFLAILSGVAVYCISGVAFGLMALGVGFMEEPSRTIYGHAIVFAPLFLSGLVVGLLARAEQYRLAVLTALLSFLIFLGAGGGPVPFILRNEESYFALAIQSIYQAATYTVLCLGGCWLGLKSRSVRVRSNPSVKGTSCGKPQAAPYLER